MGKAASRNYLERLFGKRLMRKREGGKDREIDEDLKMYVEDNDDTVCTYKRERERHYNDRAGCKGVDGG